MKHDLKSVLATNLRRLLKKREMTQADLAMRSAVDLKTIGNIIRASHRSRTDTLEALANALGASVSELVAVPHSETTYNGVTLSVQEELLLDAYNACDGEAKRVLLGLGEILAARSHRGET